jgi:2-hydroxychromene-2-carboxylate isomerase|tara:strand:- start:674 stop:1330 length:657 start_codon:yes stop_codon:yes gene_type:complete
MTQIIDFYFDVGSPASYLAWTQLPALAQRANSDIRWKPMLLGGVFKATGNNSPAEVPAKSRYNRLDMSRAATGYSVPLNFNPYFPVNTLQVMRGAVAYLSTLQFDDYLQAVFEAMWVNGKNLADSAVLAEVLAGAGFDPGEVFALCKGSSAKENLQLITAEAVERGVFGAPTFFVGNEMFFGQDRMNQLEECLRTENRQPATLAFDYVDEELVWTPIN